MKTKVVHSQSKTAWNIVGEELGKKYKIARVPYIKIEDSFDTSNIIDGTLFHREIINTREKSEALEIAMHLSKAMETFKPKQG